MAERLTIRHGNRADCNTLCMEDCDHCWHLGIIREKLARLEDLEEQGRLITLPCKIGDTVYGIRRYQDRIVKAGTVSEMFYNRDGELIIAIKNVCRGCWGRQIFGTYEEAEAALKGAENATR